MRCWDRSSGSERSRRPVFSSTGDGEPSAATAMIGRRRFLEVLAALGKAANPPTGNMFVPTPNHDHVVDNSRVDTGPIWWEVRPVLIMDQSDWPAPDGSSGITSAKAMDDAEAAGRAIEVGSNFFLFFSSSQATSAASPHSGHAMP